MAKSRSSKKLTATNSLSPFVIICGIAALVYLIYRLILLAFPATIASEYLLGKNYSEPALCQQDDIDLKDPTSILSSGYQQYLKNQPALSENLTDRPKIEEASPISITNDATYRYSFEYRSDSPVQIMIEFQKKPDTDLIFQEITTVPAAQDWQQFIAHFDNNEPMIRLHVVAKPAESNHFESRGFAVHQIPDAELKKGMVSIVFDDGWKSAGNAVPLLDKYNIRSTQYIMTDIAKQNTRDYMGIKTIQALKNDGHEIGSHSLTHCNQTLLQEAELKDNATKSKATLEQQGLGPVKSFAYPYGQYNASTQQIYTKEFPFIRTSDAGYNDRYFDTVNIRSMGVLQSTDEKTFKSWLDYAAKNNQWVVIVYHQVDEAGQYSVTSAQLEQHLALIAKSKMNIMPLGQAAEAIKNFKQTQPPPTAPMELPQTGDDSIIIKSLQFGIFTGIILYWAKSRRTQWL